MADERKRPMRRLLITQFLGAFNDNAWKLLVTLLAVATAVGSLSDPNAREAVTMAQTTIAFAVFTLPLMLFSIPAAPIADRFSKRTIILAMKAVEVVLMAAATATLAFAPGGGTLALVVLGLMGLQSAIFSPAKYGIIPEIVPHERLSEANGRLEAWTFFAIIAGTVSGGLLLEATRGYIWVAGLVLTLLSVAGLFAATGVPRVPAARAAVGLRETVGGAWKAVRSDRPLLLSVAGQALFWGMASLLTQVMLVYSKTTFDLSEKFVAAPLAVLLIGIGVGSRIAGRMSHAKVELGLIPLGAVMLSAATLMFGLVRPDLVFSVPLLVVIGIASGLILVPLDSVLQWRAPRDRRGGVIALTNFFAFGGTLAGTLGAQSLSSLGLDSAGILVAAAVALAACTAWAIYLLPVAFLRMIAVILTHTIYRQRVIGRANVPAEGGVLLVPNHVSFVDGVFLAASIDRPVRFVVESEWFEKPLARLLLKTLGAIPIATDDGPKATLRSLKRAGEYLDRGDVVCIFAEGQITRTGMLLPFKRGLERILKGREVPVIPVRLHGVWGSVFSYAGGKFVSKLPQRIPYPVTVVFGERMPASASFQDVRTAVHELGELAWRLDHDAGVPLHVRFVRRMRRWPWRSAFTDESGRRMRRLGALTGAVAMARALKRDWTGQSHVGVLLPPCIPGALVNIAASLAGRTSVNLNYTTGPDGIASAVQQSGVTTVVTSRAFLEKVGVVLPDSVRVVWIEDVAQAIGRFDRLKALLLSVFAPVGRLERACGAERRVRVDDVATVIFSSGSTGEPKGIMLTHGNIAANVDAASQVLRLERGDRLLGSLPLFHSFGFLVLWVAAARGAGVVFCPNPLDAARVGGLVRDERCTILIATPTFLQFYMKRCTPAQFGSLRLVVAGAEKLSERVALAFEDTFGLRPLEGYGTTECAPVIATSAPDFRAPGFFQPGARRGSVGQPLPGVIVRVVDPETHEPRRAGEAGLLLVKGPNVMKGYLGKPELTQQVLLDGWYVTGDIGVLDEDGFLKITDRLSRFSKIGGEMVPHGKVEEALQGMVEREERVFAVTSVRDDKKGERLAVVHTLPPELLQEVVAKLQASDLPNLFRPRRDDFIPVDELPILGTGKLDLGAVRRIATEALEVDSANAAVAAAR